MTYFHPDGESYICRYFTDYESANGGDLDIEMDDSRNDESYQITMDTGNSNFKAIWPFLYPGLKVKVQ